MSAAALTADQIANTVMQALVRTRFRLADEEWAAIEEGIRRIRQHEDLVANVLPDLRRRLDAAELRTAANSVPCAS
jgi:hypothetical protein